MEGICPGCGGVWTDHGAYCKPEETRQEPPKRVDVFLRSARLFDGSLTIAHPAIVPHRAYLDAQGAIQVEPYRYEQPAATQFKWRCQHGQETKICAECYYDK